MSKFEKALDRLKKIPADFKWDEAVRIFSRLGYELDESGGGSDFSFVNEKTNAVFYMPKPHGKGSKPAVKKHYLKEMVKHLEGHGLI